MLPSKTCLRCETRKTWDQFYAAKKWPDGSMRSPQSYCKPCRHAMANEWQRDNREWRRKWDRERYARLKDDPEWMGERRDINRESQRRRFNRTPRRQSQTPSVEVMAAPFGEWITHVMARDGVTLVDLAERWGISDRTLYAVRTGERATVKLATVEAALCADGTCLVSDLYDDQELAA